MEKAEIRQVKNLVKAKKVTPEEGERLIAALRFLDRKRSEGNAKIGSRRIVQKKRS